MKNPDKESEKILNDSIKFIKKRQKWIIEKFADSDIFKPSEQPLTLIMSGAPGSGKTEFSKRIIPRYEEKIGHKIVRIDADDIRDTIPYYTGKNSDLMQGAASIGVEKLHDYVLKNNINFLLDGTLANYDKAINNITRSLNKNREIIIYFIYQDPFKAWAFAKKREKLEGRSIPKQAFIDAYFKSNSNIGRLKKYFKNQILVFLIKKDYNNNDAKTYANINGIDKYLDKVYSRKLLNNKLRDNL